VPVGSSPDPAKLDDRIPQPVQINLEGRQQQPGRPPIALGQADVGGDPPVPPRPSPVSAG